MKKTILAALAIAMGWALTAAAFTDPTAEQIAAAAADPAAQLAALLQDASVNQAAAIAAQVAERIAALGLSAEDQAARLDQTIQALFAAVPTIQHEALAAAFGEAMAGVTGLSGAGYAAIRTALGATAGGDTLLPSFDQAFTTAGGTLPPADNPEPPDSNGPPPPPPPPPPNPDPEPDDDEPEPPPPGPDYPGQTID